MSFVPVRVGNVSRHWHLSPPHEVKSILLESGLEEQFDSTLYSLHRRTRLGVDERAAVWGLVGRAALSMEGQNPSLVSFLLWLSPSFPPGDDSVSLNSETHASEETPCPLAWLARQERHEAQEAVLFLSLRRSVPYSAGFIGSGVSSFYQV